MRVPPDPLLCSWPNSSLKEVISHDSFLLHCLCFIKGLVNQ